MGSGFGDHGKEAAEAFLAFAQRGFHSFVLGDVLRADGNGRGRFGHEPAPARFAGRVVWPARGRGR